MRPRTPRSEVFAPQLHCAFFEHPKT